MEQNLKTQRLGETNFNKHGKKMTIIEYNNAHDIIVKFDNGYTKKCEYKQFKKGTVKNIKEKVGEINYNIYGNEMKIIDFTNVLNIIVKFKNGFITKTRYNLFKRGNVSSPYDKTVYNTGYIGEGKYRVSINNKMTLRYQIWSDMIERCYDKKKQKRNPTYIDCTVCNEWHNYQVFSKWVDENYYEINNQKIALDKDILIKNNKIYSPDTCLFVPQNINTLFIKSDKIRGDYPIGVTFDKKNNRFFAQCKIGNKINKYLGYYNTPEEAFYAYKKFKEKYIKQVADEYKNKYPNFPRKLYDAMYKYKVEITD